MGIQFKFGLDPRNSKAHFFLKLIKNYRLKNENGPDVRSLDLHKICSMWNIDLNYIWSASIQCIVP